MKYDESVKLNLTRDKREVVLKLNSRFKNIIVINM